MNHKAAALKRLTAKYRVANAGFPMVIVRPKTTSDVVKTINFVREHGGGITFCVTCGAHSTKCMMTDSFVLDLVNIRDVTVDPNALTASVGGGAYLYDLDEALAPHGLGVTVGSYPWTGVGGLVLAGGFGWLGRSYGFSVDNLLEVEAVLADGSVVVANDDNEHASLIWGFRGGGGNFGVVTRFTFRVHRSVSTQTALKLAYLIPRHSAAAGCPRIAWADFGPSSPQRPSPPSRSTCHKLRG